MVTAGSYQPLLPTVVVAAASSSSARHPDADDVQAVSEAGGGFANRRCADGAPSMQLGGASWRYAGVARNHSAGGVPGTEREDRLLCLHDGQGLNVSREGVSEPERSTSSETRSADLEAAPERDPVIPNDENTHAVPLYEEAREDARVQQRHALWHALHRPAVALLVGAMLVCLGVCVCCWAMSFIGWILVLWLLDCKEQQNLRGWLFLYLACSLGEICVAQLVRRCVEQVTRGLDSRIRPGFARVCYVGYTVVASALKIFWCIHVQVLVATAADDRPKLHGSEQRTGAHDDGWASCGESLRRFLSWYSCLMLLRLLAVDAFLHLFAGLVLRAVSSTLRPHSRGARAGTIDRMTVVDYSPKLFADDANPADERPQKECCFCLEEYNAEAAIVQTPCSHFMHRDCLDRWLQQSHVCPICRSDLEDAFIV